MKKILNSLLLFLFILPLTYCSTIPSPNIQKDYIEFYANVLTRRPHLVKHQNKTEVYIRVAIPNHSLIYLKTDNGFKADFTITTTFLRKSDQSIRTEVRTGSINVKTFDETKREQTFLDLFSYFVPPDEYKIKIHYISDVKECVYNYVISAPIYTQFSIGSIDLVETVQDTIAQSKFFPIYDDFEDLYFTTEFYNLPKGQVNILYDIVNMSGKVLDSYQSVLDVYKFLDVFRYSEILYIPLKNIDFGNYIFRVTMQSMTDTTSVEINFIKKEPVLKYMTDREYKESPVAYTLDVGVNNGQTSLVEVNDMWAIGSYGFDSKIYALP